MTFRDELAARIATYTKELEPLKARLIHLESLIAHARALIEEEEQRGQLPLGIENGHNQEEEGPQPVSEAVNEVLANGPARYKEINQTIARDFPRVKVAHMEKSVSSALKWGIKKGKYVKLERGLYMLA